MRDDGVPSSGYFRPNGLPVSPAPTDLACEQSEFHYQLFQPSTLPDWRHHSALALGEHHHHCAGEYH